uniref:Otopetrin 3 n=1 Tax=Mastacembelus armatus TaxID=205130 RepID=A0A7N8X565_9TELE
MSGVSWIAATPAAMWEGKHSLADTFTCSGAAFQDQLMKETRGNRMETKERLLSGLLGLNVVLLGAALVAGQAFNPDGLKHQEPEVFILMLMGVSLIWMLWYLLWARKQPGTSPHKDHHAGGLTVICKFSVILTANEKTYVVESVMNLFFPLINLIRSFQKKQKAFGVDQNKCLLFGNIVRNKSLYNENKPIGSNRTPRDSHLPPGNSTLCRCSDSATCLVFRKGFEILYPFNIEFYLMASCMVYVMWKNVGRRLSPGHHVTQKLTLRIVYQGGIIYGIVFGALALIAGSTIFILYQVWVSQQQLRFNAFLIFYSYHLAVLPVMCLCCLAGMLVYRLEMRARMGGRNPTRRLDVILLVAAAMGQIALSYFSLVSALAVGTNGLLGELDLSYSLLSLLELILQNIFIIEGLHRHPSLSVRKKQKSSIFKVPAFLLSLVIKKPVTPVPEERSTDISLLEGNTSAPPAVQEHDGKKSRTRTVIQEICAFLILSNIMLWIIPAFGVHPHFENGLGKQFFGFSAWLVLVNLGQPLIVFYRMHSVGALLELLINA